MPENATEHINCHLNLKEKNKTLVARPYMFHCLCSFITFFLQSHYMKVEQSSSVMRLSHSTPTKLDCIRGSETNLRGAAPQPRLPFPEVESPSLSVHLHHQRASLSHVILTCAKSVANSSSNVYTALAQACKAT